MEEGSCGEVGNEARPQPGGHRDVRWKVASSESAKHGRQRQDADRAHEGWRPLPRAP